MKIILIKRGKITHCGIQRKSMDEVYEISICNGRWVDTDKTSIGGTEEVTCKRCRKIIAKADENGVVNL